MKIPDQVRDGRGTRQILFLFAVCCLTVGLACPGHADFQIPEKPEGYVTDRAALLSVGPRQTLENQLREFELQTSNQVVVATFPSLEGESLEDLSIRIAQKWKIGQKNRDNGVLFLVFKDDRQMRIEVGYGLEGVLTDALSAQIIRNEVMPYFRQEQYEGGVLSGIKAILSATQGEYQPMASAQSEGGASLFKLIFWIIGVILVIDLIRYSAYMKTHQGYKGRYSFWEWFFMFAMLWLILRALLTSRSGSGWSSGRRGGGGGFSGGGGSFGGGGASGRW